MSIPISQLETWARYVDAPHSKRTADIIRNELERMGTTLTTRGYEVYLQGSYRNATNIFRDSDVDIVVELSSIFFSDLSKLDDHERYLWRHAYSDSSLTLDEFRSQVFRQLTSRFGQNMVKDGDKAIKVGGTGERLNADVLVCAEYRGWEWFVGREPHQHSFVPGITFWTQDDRRQVINYPKVHYNNGVKKQENSNQWFKPTVRMVKNARRLMYRRNILEYGTAPSYFIQCLLYNVPDHLFGLTHQQNYQDVVNWLEAADLARFVCQHEKHSLFGPSPEQWDISSAKLLIRGLKSLWHTWK